MSSRVGLVTHLSIDQYIAVALASELVSLVVQRLL